MACEGAIGQELNWRTPAIDRPIVAMAGQTLQQRAGQVAGQFLAAENATAAAIADQGPPLPNTRPESAKGKVLLRGLTGLSSRVGVEISSQDWCYEPAPARTAELVLEGDQGYHREPAG